MSKAGFMKDAAVLFAITLVAGAALGGVYQVTKEPISRAAVAYKAVFNEAESFELDDALTEAIEGCNTELAGMNYGSVAVETVLKAVDAGGNQLGYVITALSNDSYGGAIKLSVGLKEDGTITGIEFLEINDTPGLGLKAKEPEFKSQFAGKKAEALSVTKSGSGSDNEIAAISGATITSSATTNAVNAALYYLHNCIGK